MSTIIGAAADDTGSGEQPAVPITSIAVIAIWIEVNRANNEAPD
jgi:hypothetical protein